MKHRDRTHLSPVHGLPMASGSTNRARSLKIAGSFFDGRTPTTWKPHAIGRPVEEIPVEFIAIDPNGFGMQSRDFGDLLNAAVPSPLGFASRDPTPLLFIQTAEDQIEVAMILFFRFFANPTCRTPTFVNHNLRCHHRPPFLARPETTKFSHIAEQMLEGC